ncbi:MAG: snoRNA-binding rRNA-processing protein utp10 [Caeruleum heppii]|nr:MAG: snoRNA-binding rRNA-processing protein utp10 [Caeruleum heppii]
MASSLALQLSQIAAQTKGGNPLNLKAQRAAHGQSLLFDPKVAVDQDFDTLYTICSEGLHELILLDRRFATFARNVFSEQSKSEDRSQMTAGENDELNEVLNDFLGLLGSKLLLKPAVKALEWLVRRFRIHEYNTERLLLVSLPYHDSEIFRILLSILPSNIPHNFKFLHPYIRSLTNPPRHAIVYAMTNTRPLFTIFNGFVLGVAKRSQHHHALLRFWAGVMTEAVAGMMDQVRSGRAAVQRQSQEDVLLLILPILDQGLAMKKVPELRIGCYMIISIMVTKASLETRVLTGLMEAVLAGWTTDTVFPALTCLAVLTQVLDDPTLPRAITTELLKADKLLEMLVHLSQSTNIHRLVYGLANGIIADISRTESIRGLEVLQTALTLRLVNESQIDTIMESILQAAVRLESDHTSSEVREQLGHLVEDVSASSVLGERLQKALQDSHIDVDMLELKLQTVIRLEGPLGQAPSREIEMPDQEPSESAMASFDNAVARVPTRTASEVSFLAHSKSHLFTALLQVFLSAQGEKNNVKRFAELPVLHKDSALQETLFISFFVRVWCGPFAAVARRAALRTVIDLLSAAEQGSTDLQAILPYILVALADPSDGVRRDAADLIVAIHRLYPNAKKKGKREDLSQHWGQSDLYGTADATKNTKWMSTEEAASFIETMLLPAVEECILDHHHVRRLVVRALKGDNVHHPRSIKTEVAPLKASHRLSIFEQLASHVINTPLCAVQVHLLEILNSVRKVVSANRTTLLLPALQRWSDQEAEITLQTCKSEAVGIQKIDQQMVGVVTAGSKDGIRLLQDIIENQAGSSRPTLVQAALDRLRRLWTAFKPDVQLSVAHFLLDYALGRSLDNLALRASRAHATDVLRSLKLSTEILIRFLAQPHETQDPHDTQPASKRRRIGHNEKVSSTSMDEDSAAARMSRLTFILEVIDSSRSEEQAGLLGPLFQVLMELQQTKAQTGSEMAYLQTLVLASLLGLVNTFKESSRDLDRAAVRTDVLVDCIRSTGSPQVQDAALLVVANLAEVAPELVLHSVMPVFTYMGSTVLRHDDDYSIHVIDQTIQKVVPPLLASLRIQKRDLVVGTAELILSFVAAFEHVPSHRRLRLYTSLISTLGEKDFLFAFLAALVNKYEGEEKVTKFCIELATHFEPQTQLTAIYKFVELVEDALKPDRTISDVLLTVRSSNTGRAPEAVLPLFKFLGLLLREERLMQRVRGAAANEDPPDSHLWSFLSEIIQQMLRLTEHVSHDGEVFEACGDALSALLTVLSLPELIDSIEPLLAQSSDEIRRKVLKAVQVRVQKEKPGSLKSQTASLSLLPRVTSIIEESSDVPLKQSAVACVDQIIEKFGKTNIDAVASVSRVVVGPACLGSKDTRTWTIALLCLSTCVEILGAGIVPLLPQLQPRTLQLLSFGLERVTRAVEVHNAVYSLLGMTAIHVPWMITGKYLDSILTLSHQSAQASLDAEANNNRVELLRILPRQVDAKEYLAAMERTWLHAVKTGFRATTEHLDMLVIYIERQPKSEVTRHSRLLETFCRKALDLRRAAVEDGLGDLDSAELTLLESSIIQVLINAVMKMNDSSFRPMFIRLVEWTSEATGKMGERSKTLRLASLFGFLDKFFGTLKSIVTGYASHIIESGVEALRNVSPEDKESVMLWTTVCRTLTKAFEHDQDDFWQAPSHFNVIGPVLIAQLGKSRSLAVLNEVVPAITELGRAVESTDLRKEMNGAIMKHMRADDAQTRLAAVKCEQALTDRLDEEWLALLPEMLPFISELQEDDDESVERETHRWIGKIEAILGESLEGMLQ